MTALAYLADRTDARVIRALKRVCRICDAPKGQDCQHPFKGPALNRIVHLDRTYTAKGVQ